MAMNGSGKFSHAMSSGLVSTIAWGIVLIIYCVFRFNGVEDPLLGQVFLLLTGTWVGNLTLVQGKKQARVEEKVDTLLETVKASDLRADQTEARADESEKRESEPSKHRERKETDRGDQ